MSSQLLRPTATAQQPLLHVSIGPFAPGDSNLPNRSLPSFEQDAPSIQDVLVNKDQAWTGSRTYSRAVYWPE